MIICRYHLHAHDLSLSSVIIICHYHLSLSSVIIICHDHVAAMLEIISVASPVRTALRNRL
jgi:hypothetical protein